MNPVAAAIETMVAGRSLSRTLCRDAVAAMLDGEATEILVAAFLTCMRLKGLTADELEAAVAAVRERMIRWECGPARDLALDTCGTGGDGASTVNISTAVAVVVAACGIPIIKHGNRAASGHSGSSDVLSVLGVSIDLEPPLLIRSLAELKIAFLFAPRFHPGLGKVAAVRRQLPFGTLFNLVGPLCNPASPAYQLIGTPGASDADLLAEVLARLEHVKRAAVVSAADGLDEVTLDGETQVRVIECGRIQRITWEPEEFGLGRQSASGIQARDAHESAQRLKRVLEGERGPVRDYVLANCAAALWVTGQGSLRDTVSQAAGVIDSGAAARLLARWAEIRPDKIP
jgi:anthranilate phosphoribosyltransferase